MNTKTKDSWKKALLVLIFVVMAATVFSVSNIAPLSLMRSSLDNNIVGPTDELRTCQSSAGKMRIIQTLGTLNEPSTTGAFRKCLGDRELAVRVAAISAIAKMRGLLALATLHTDPTVRDLAKLARLKRAAEMSSDEILESLEDLWRQHPKSN